MAAGAGGGPTHPHDPPMPGDLVESVPNFSEGRRGEVVDEIVAAFAGAHPDVLVLDRSSDPDHNRSVLTLAGPGPALVEAAVAGTAACARLIDLTRHRGAHPRMGALDVLPFVPLRVGDDHLDHLGACAALAVAAGRRLAEEVGIPVYLYGAAALRADRARLPDVRGKGFEELRAVAARDPGRAPDLGGPAPHPTAGATAVGARPFLIAYNVNLATGDPAPARRIARAVRERGGGLPAVRALGLVLHGRGITQVSMNLLDFRVTPPTAAFAAVAELARRERVEVVDSEIVGLVPEAALAGTDPASLALRDFSPDRLLEERLRRALVHRHELAGFTKRRHKGDTPCQRLEGDR